MPRNSSGTYSLPAGNPVVSNTLIQSTWANTTLSDVSTAMTDSLDRNGRGSMLAPLKNTDGTAVAPSITFASEGTLGIYRPSAGVLGIAAGGALVLSIAAAGLTFTNPVILPIGSAAAPSLTFVANTNTGIYSPTTNQVAVTTNGAQRLLIDATGNVTIATGGLTLTSGAVTVTNGAVTLTTGPLVMGVAGANVIQASNATGSLQFQTGGANTRLTVTNTAVQPAVVIVSALGESLRTTNDSAFISFYDTTGATRNGYLQGTTGSFLMLMAENGNNLRLGTNGAARLYITAGGNIGFGNSPNAWSTLQAFEGTSGALAFNGTSAMYLMQNLYYNGANYVYRTTAAATLYYQSAGAHSWFVAPSGTAGGAATMVPQLMLDNSGNLLLGTSTPAWSSAGRGVIEVNGSTNALVGLKVAGVASGYLQHDGAALNLFNNSASGGVQFGTNGTLRMSITVGGVIQDAAGNELGYKGLPQTNLIVGYTLVVGDRGKHIYQRSAGSVTVPSGVFSVGDAVTIVNGTTGNISVVQGASVTMQQAGTTNTGNRTLLPFGVCTVICVASNNFHISGTIT